MPSDRARVDANRAWWNERAQHHRHTILYKQHIRRLREGGLALLPLDVAELGDIRGRQVLHTQCHIGTDTLSLARMGAHVTGVDFSQVAIEEARKLSEELEIAAQFEVCENDKLSERFGSNFDLVFTSHGVLTWLPNLTSWAEQIAGCLVPGGRFYLSELHPLMWSLADKRAVTDTGLKLAYPYLSMRRSMMFVESGSYADKTLETRNNTTYEWPWGVGDVINALIGAGLVITQLKEHPRGFYPVSPEFVECSDGHYQLPATIHGRFPVTMTVKAFKPC